MNLLRRTLASILVLATAAIAEAMTMIFPVEAIDDLWTLGAEEFRAKYSGINISGLSPSDEGWYVRYRHENLTYLFGPVADREEARKKKWEMEAVRDAAIRNRATLASSQVDYVRFTYSGVFGRGGGNAPYDGSGPRISEDGKSGPDGDMDGDGISNAQDDDMDGDGIPNGQDGDADGDGIPNGADDYSFGAYPGGEDMAGQQAGGGEGGSGDQQGSEAGKLAGADGQQQGGQDGQQQGGQQGGQDGRQQGGQQGGQQGQQMAGSQGSDGQQGQQGQQGQRRVASNQRGQQQSSQSGQSGQQGQQGQPGQPSSQGGSPGQPGQPSTPSSGSPSSGNPLLALLRMILGL